MQPKERRKLIIEKLSENEKLDIELLSEQLQVSSMTIRRDLSCLEEEEKIIRTHGGAVLKKALINESSFEAKEGKNNQQKKAIAEAAAKRIQNHSTILLDSGTTTIEIAKLLKGKQGLTVLTNDIKIAAELMDSDIKVIVFGGELQNSIGALFGPITELILKDIHVDIFFLGAHAIHLQAGITAPTFEKATIKKLMIDSAESTWLVADSSKFDQKSLTKVCGFTSLTGIITDAGVSKEIVDELEQQIEVVLTGGDEIYESGSHSG